jgi:hypothetical protein
MPEPNVLDFCVSDTTIIRPFKFIVLAFRHLSHRLIIFNPLFTQFMARAAQARQILEQSAHCPADEDRDMFRR